mmetsp:Transcript_6026/g.15426  ORF Transcript_6026/g.15426 Transcript_6026/m.15426 type:complete len:320 (-) Transcript_6026:165-1124(-)
MSTTAVAIAAFAIASVGAAPTPLRVLVTGAGGRTGVLCFKKLAERPDDFAPPIGLVRSDASAKKVRRMVSCADEQLVRADVTSTSAMTTALRGQEIDALVICTSAVPKVRKLSILKLLVGKLLRRKGGRPSFYWSGGGTPEEVDYYGMLAQVDAAKQLGVRHIVAVSSMGGTDESNFLNQIGLKPDGTGGQILLWKRKGEKYLVGSGIDYTIIHPGGLLDEEGGKRELVLGVNDELLARTSRSIPRADVAELCVQALLSDAAKNKAFDAVSEPEGEGKGATTDFGSLFRSLTRAYDYSSNEPPEPKAALPAGWCRDSSS